MAFFLVMAAERHWLIRLQVSEDIHRLLSHSGTLDAQDSTSCLGGL
jgi:hypothetical protein